MKTIDRIPNFSKISGLFILLILVSTSGFAQIKNENRSELIKPETEITNDLFWHVKAFRPEAQLLKVKAVDKKGNIYDVKAIQSSESTSVLNVKAIVNDKQFPIKVILPTGNDKYYPVMAITEKGKLLTIKAFTSDNRYLDIKGVSKTGNIIHLSAITDDNKAFTIISISPFGEVNSVVGVKMTDSVEEAVINGVSVFAHVKAIKQD
ncbi:MAG: hypothetical protein KUG68_04570 [Flavobacteriaceae bacterium]|nr:hypothetical protein [Flavobacteriaceae bacterium]